MTYDRGSIKWVTLMLPEHAELLKALWSEDHKVTVTKPILDPQEIEMMNEQLVHAFEHQPFISLFVYKDGTINDLFGTITKLDKYAKCITFLLKDKEERNIAFKHIISVKN